LHPRDSPYASLVHPPRHPQSSASFLPRAKPLPIHSLPRVLPPSCLGVRAPTRSSVSRRGEVEEECAEPRQPPGRSAAGCAEAIGAGLAQMAAARGGEGVLRGGGGGGPVPCRAAREVRRRASEGDGGYRAASCRAGKQRMTKSGGPPNASIQLALGSRPAARSTCDSTLLPPCMGVVVLPPWMRRVGGGEGIG